MWRRRSRRTWTHVVRAPATKVATNGTHDRQPKIRQLYILSIVRAEYVLRLDISMEDPHVVAVLNGVDKLNKRLLNESTVVLEDALLGDGSEEVATSA